MATIDLSKLTTERRNPNTMDLDTFSPLEIATTMNNEDLNVEIGYCYGSKYWGCGYATEALKKVINYIKMTKSSFLSSFVFSI